MSDLGTLHHDLYFQRMAASLGDKMRLVAHLRPGAVLDLGCGDGVLLAALAGLGYTGVGVDASPEAVDRAEAKLSGVGVPVVQADLTRASELLAALEGRRFENVIASSVLHEVVSYGSRQAQDELLHAVGTLLAPGGRFLVRDGVGPAEPDEHWRFTPASPDALAFLDAWRAMSTPATQALLADLSVDGSGRIHGPARSVTEFCFTYVWGWGSLPREGSEWYTVAGTAADFAANVERASLTRLTHLESYLQDGYRTHLDELGSLDAETRDGFRPAPWPDSNALWVFER